MKDNHRIVIAGGVLAITVLGLGVTGCLNGAAGTDPSCDVLGQLQEFAVDFARQLLAAYLL